MIKVDEKKLEFPSPTGVTYYERNDGFVIERCSEFPSPTGATYYEYNSVVTGGLSNDLEFPSPTGATYYEFVVKDYTDRVYVIKEFPSPTGATYYEFR